MAELLSHVLMEIFRRQSFGAGASGPAAPKGFMLKGQVVSFPGTGNWMVSIEGQVVEAKPTTDEVFADGSMVWVSQTPEGWVIHGGVR